MILVWGWSDHKTCKYLHQIIGTLKVVCFHCILIHQGLTGSSAFMCQMKAHIVFIITPNLQLQIHYTLAAFENVPSFGIPILIFLCIFITASSPVSHSYIFASGEKIRNNLDVKLYKKCLRGQGPSVKGENTHVKMSTYLFKYFKEIF